MVAKEETFESISQEFIKTQLTLTALIQDIQQCTGSLELLNDLNAEGRIQIAKLRKNIEHLTDLAERERDKKRKADYLVDINNHKGQFSTVMTAFQRANVVSACAIDKMSRESLLSSSPEQQNILRKRKDKDTVANMSNRISERLLDVSKYLAETTQRSAETLDTLVTSSEKVSSTRKELEQQQQVIVQSGKLLSKYGRREITDKALLILAFIFFLACVFYIIQKRLF